MRVLFLFFIVCFSLVSAKHLPENLSNFRELRQNDKIDSNKKSDALERDDDNDGKSIDIDNYFKNIINEVINKRLEKLERKHEKEVNKLNKELEKLEEKIQKVQSKLNENDDDDSSDSDESSDSDTSEDNSSERKEMQKLSERQEHIKEQLEYKKREFVEEKLELENQRRQLFEKIAKQQGELGKNDDQESKKQDREDKHDKNIDDSLEKDIDKHLRKYVQKQQREERRKQEQERRREEKERKNRERLEKLRHKQEEQERKREEQERKHKEWLEKLNHNQEDNDRKRQEWGQKFDKLKNESNENSDESNSNENDSIEVDDIWKNYIYEKYGLSPFSNGFQKKIAIRKYLQDELGLNINSTKSERRQAVIKLMQEKLPNSDVATNYFKNHLLSQVNASELQALQSKLDFKISKLSNESRYLKNISSPEAVIAQQYVDEKKTLLQAFSTFLSNLLPTWINSGSTTANGTHHTEGTVSSNDVNTVVNNMPTSDSNVPVGVGVPGSSAPSINNPDPTVHIVPQIDNTGIDDSNLPTAIPNDITSATNSGNVAANNEPSAISVQSSNDANTNINNAPTDVTSGSDSSINNDSSTVYTESTLIPEGSAPSSSDTVASINDESATISASATINDNTATNNIATTVSSSIVQPNNNNVVDALSGNNIPATDSTISKDAPTTEDLSPNNIGSAVSTSPVANEAVIVNDLFTANTSVSGDGVSSANDIATSSNSVPAIIDISSTVSNKSAVVTSSSAGPELPIDTGKTVNNLITTEAAGLVVDISSANGVDSAATNTTTVDVVNISIADAVAPVDGVSSPNNVDIVVTGSIPNKTIIVINDLLGAETTVQSNGSSISNATESSAVEVSIVDSATSSAPLADQVGNSSAKNNDNATFIEKIEAIETVSDGNYISIDTATSIVDSVTPADAKYTAADTLLSNESSAAVNNLTVAETSFTGVSNDTVNNDSKTDATVSVHDVSPSNVNAVDTISDGSTAIPNDILVNNEPTTDLGLVDGASLSNNVNTTVDNKPAVDANSSIGSSALSIDSTNASLPPNNFESPANDAATVIFSNESTTDAVVPAVGVLPPNDVVIAVNNVPIFNATTPTESIAQSNDVDTIVNKKQTSTAPSNDAVVTEVNISVTDNIVSANAASLVNDVGVAEDSAPSADTTVSDASSNDTSATAEWPASADGVSSPNDSISSPVNASINNKTTSNDIDGSVAILNDAHTASALNVTDTSVTNPASNSSAVILNDASSPNSSNVLTENSDSASTILVTNSIFTTPASKIDASGVMSTESNVFVTDILPAETVVPETVSSGTLNLTVNNFIDPAFSPTTFAPSSSVVSAETEQPNSGSLLDSTAKIVTTPNPEVATVSALDTTTVIRSTSGASNSEVLSADTSNDTLNKSSVSVGELSTVAPITDYVPTSSTEAIQLISVETALINTSTTSVTDATSNDGNNPVNANVAPESTGFLKEPEYASVLAGENGVPIPQETGATIVEINTQ